MVSASSSASSGAWVDLCEFRQRLAAGELEAAVQAGSGELLAG